MARLPPGSRTHRVPGRSVARVGRWLRLTDPVPTARDDQGVRDGAARRGGTAEHDRGSLRQPRRRLGAGHHGTRTTGWNADVLHELLVRYDNVAAALTWCLDRDAEPTRSLLLCSVLWGVVHNGHVEDVAQLGRRTLQRWPDPEQPFWPDAVASLASATLMLGDIDGGVALAESALPHADPSLFARATLRRVLGLAAQAVDDHERAAALFAEVASVSRSSGAGAMAMEADVFRAQALLLGGRHDEGLRIVRDCRREAETGGWHINTVFATIVEGLILLSLDAAAAWSCLTQALEASRAARYPYGVTASLQSMAYAHLRHGRDDAAVTTIVELVDEMAASPSDWSRADPLGPVATLMHRRGMSGWEDMAATTEWLSRASPLPAAGLHLVDLPPTRGRVLPAREATEAMFIALASAGDSARAGPPANAPSAPTGSVANASFTLDGEMWTVTYAGVSAHIKSTKACTTSPSSSVVPVPTSVVSTSQVQQSTSTIRARSSTPKRGDSTRAGSASSNQTSTKPNRTATTSAPNAPKPNSTQSSNTSPHPSDSRAGLDAMSERPSGHDPLSPDGSEPPSRGSRPPIRGSAHTYTAPSTPVSTAATNPRCQRIGRCEHTM